MVKQSAVDSLKESIRLLEIRQAEEERLLREHFKLTCESLKPVNLIRSSVKELVSSQELKNNIFETVISLLSGYLTKNLIIGSKNNPFMKLLGTVIQFGMTGIVAKNAKFIRTFFVNVINRFMNPDEEDVAESEASSTTTDSTTDTTSFTGEQNEEKNNSL